MNSFEKTVKRGFDVMISGGLLLIFSPLWVTVATAIKTTSKGPILFIQDRPGYHKEIFKVYKFRTMKPGSDVMVKGKEVSNDDERITSIGKVLRRTKIDEVPQILNVIKGDMSLVGPRPERIISLEDYDEKISRRLDMLPGMTGLAQVSGNIYLDLSDRYKYDVYYVDHFNLVMDFKILLRTVGVVLFGEEKYKNKPLVSFDEVKRSYGLTNGEQADEKERLSRKKCKAVAAGSFFAGIVIAALAVSRLKLR